MSTSSIHNEETRPVPLEGGLAEEALGASSAAGHGKSKHGEAFDQATKGDPDASNTPMNYLRGEQQASESHPDAFASAEAAEDEIPYPERSTDELVHPPDFKPLFTLIEDPETSEYHHPTVHYIFSDDDPEILTNATLNALQAHGELSRSEGSGDEDRVRPQDESEERYVILDMEADGKTVASASSLSSEWQALRTHVSQAPSWGDAGNDKADGKLLLKISGHESGSAVNMRSGQQQQQPQKSEMSLDELVKMFGRRLEGLDQIMDRPEKTDNESK